MFKGALCFLTAPVCVNALHDTTADNGDDDVDAVALTMLVYDYGDGASEGALKRGVYIHDCSLKFNINTEKKHFCSKHKND